MIYSSSRRILRKHLLIVDEDRLQEVVMYLERPSQGAGVLL